MPPVQADGTHYGTTQYIVSVMLSKGIDKGFGMCYCECSSRGRLTLEEVRKMKRIIIRSIGRGIHHGIGYTDSDGYGGTTDNKGRYTQKMAIDDEVSNLRGGDEYQLEVNGKIKGIFTKP